MNFNFDTATLTETEARGIVALLSILFPIRVTTFNPASSSAPAEEKAPQAALGLVPASEPETQSQPDPPATIRKRRTKAEIAADEAAKQQQPPAVGDQLAAAEAARKAAAAQQADTIRQDAAAPVNGATKIDADQLRGLLNGYIARHSMEDAIEKLRAFGCNRVTEALALESDKLSQLAATLNG